MALDSLVSDRSWLIRSLVTFLVLILYGTACALPAVYFDEGGSACTAIRLGSPTGLEALLTGWFPPWTVPWSANLFLLVGLIGGFWRRKFSFAAIFGVLAVTAGLTTFLLVPRVLTGYFLWQGAHIVFAVAAGLLAVAEARRRRSIQEFPLNSDGLFSENSLEKVPQ